MRLNKITWKTTGIYATLFCLVTLLSISIQTVLAQNSPTTQVALTSKQQLGKSVLFDEHLSLNNNQQCVSCHLNKTGWKTPDEYINKTGGNPRGSVRDRVENRTPPSLAYATFSPPLHYDPQSKEFIGGNFWDGRATGTRLGSPTAEQAQAPVVDPLEMDLPEAACVVYRVLNPPVPQLYPVRYEQVWGQETAQINWPADIETLCSQEGEASQLSNEEREKPGVVIPLSDADKNKAQTVYDNIALSVADYESSKQINEFSSKYDYYLQGKAQLTDPERKGQDLFQGAHCKECHTLDRGPGGIAPLFTDFTYHNLGVPKNPDDRFFSNEPIFNPDGINFVDPGFGQTLAKAEEFNLPSEYKQYADANYGKMKTATLRNVDRRPSPNFVKAYMHNGYFKSLKSVVHFYNTRDVLPKCADPLTRESDALAQNCWPVPQNLANLETSNVGNLGLTDEQENQIVAFLRTLSDRYQPQPQ
ncbi:MAG: c-type cytochrome [Stigonema ocellatum SAG 48.90 = DSM 106950]|nr:c-type cytochrome [Stigonema ocellatum SAG 48.90 = DSM 106950]